MLETPIFLGNSSYDLGLDNKFLSNSRKNVILGKETSSKNMFFAKITGILWFDLNPLAPKAQYPFSAEGAISL